MGEEPQGQLPTKHPGSSGCAVRVQAIKRLMGEVAGVLDSVSAFVGTAVHR